MSISSETNRISYVGTGLVTTYSYTFRIFAESHLLVTKKTAAGVVTTLVLNTDYTVSGVGDATGGSIELTTALASGADLTIRRVLPLTQPTDIANQGSFFPETHEDAFDRAIMMVQQHQDILNRTPRVPESETTIGDLPSETDRASKFLAFDSDGDPIASSGGIGDVPVSAFMETMLDDADAATARDTLGVVVADADGVTLQQAAGILSIKDSGVSTAKIAAAAVTTTKIADLNVTTGKINDLAVTTGKINDAAVTTAKLAASLGISTLNVTNLLQLAGFTASPILQIKAASTTALFNHTSGSFTATGLKVDISPKISTSRILVIAAGCARQGVGADGFLTLARNGLNLGDGTAGFHALISNNNYQVCMFYIDSPVSTSSTRYEVYSKTAGGIQIFFPAGSGSGTPQAVIVAIEIADGN